MEGPRPVLPNVKEEIWPDGAKVKFILTESGEIEVFGNRSGLKALAVICSELSRFEDCNHYHLWEDSPFMEKGSLPAIICCLENL